MDSRIVLSTFSPSVSTFLSLVEARREESTPAQIHSSLKRVFAQQTLHTNPYTHARVLKASDLQQLQRAILTARAHRRRLKAVTDVYSASSQAALASGAYVLDLCSLKAHRKSQNVLTAQAGACLSHIVSAYELRIQAPLNGVRSVGGAIATGLLGGSKMDSLLADCCTQISVMDAFGRLRVYSESAGGVMFDAVRLSMGVFGVVYEVCFRLQTGCRYVRLGTSFHSQKRLFGRGCAGIRRRLRDSVGLEAFWMPFNSYRTRKKWRAEDDVIWVRTLKAARAPKREPVDVCYTAPTMAQWMWRHACSLSAAGYAGFEGRHTPAFCRAAFVECAWKIEGVKVTTSVRHAVHYVHSEGKAVSEVCVCVPVSGARQWEALSRGWLQSVAVVEEEAGRGEFGVNCGMKVRFVGGSGALLAANRAECCALLSVCSARGTSGWERAAQRIAAIWMQVADARWVFCRGNVRTRIVSGEAVRRSLGREMDVFRAVYLAAAVDDYGMFVDSAVDEVLFGGRRWSGAERGGGGLGGDGSEQAGGGRRAKTDEKAHGVADKSSARGRRARKRAAAGDVRVGRWLALYMALYVVLWLTLFGSEARVALTRR